MTADIRTAAQREAEATWPKYPSGEGAAQIDTDRHIKRKAFRKGAVWAAARVTPTRDQLVDALAAVDVPYGGIDFYEGADAILALITDLTEKEDHGND